VTESLVSGEDLLEAVNFKKAMERLKKNDECQMEVSLRTAKAATLKPRESKVV